MRTLYLDCGMGAAGDMLAAALLELLPDPDSFVKELNALGIPGVHFSREASVKCGITGTHLAVTVDGQEEESQDFHGHGHEHMHGHEHIHGQEHGHVPSCGHVHEPVPGHEHENVHGYEQGQEHGHVHGHEHGHAHGHSHASLRDMEHLVREHLHLPERVKEKMLAAYGLIAEAESRAHGVPVQEIHFHEVGTMDAVADIAAVCLLMDRLAPDEVVVSPVHVGSGQVRCAHGILPVPAPATAWILRDVPVYSAGIQGELCTPTGAALLKIFAARFGQMPPMRVQAIGYGMGKKDFEAANCVRAMLGEAEAAPEEVCELCCNVDDMTGEAVGFAMERLFEAGALDVYTMPIGMKKGRPGILLHAMCKEAEKEAVLRAMFAHTATIGVRENRFRRHVLNRRVETLDTPYGEVRRKVSEGYGVRRGKYEYEDLARIAKEQGISLAEAEALADREGLR